MIEAREERENVFIFLGVNSLLLDLQKLTRLAISLAPRSPSQPKAKLEHLIQKVLHPCWGRSNTNHQGLCTQRAPCFEFNTLLSPS